MFDPATPAEYKSMLIAKIGKRFDWLTEQLQGKDYLMGKQFTVADAYLFTVMRWSHFVGIDLTKWPVLNEYVARVAARPKVHQALLAEGLVKQTATA